MNPTLKHATNTTLQLHRRSFYRAAKIQPGTTVVCEKGILWLTQPGDFEDHMLKPGQRLVIGKLNNVLIEALSEANLSIMYPN